MEWLDGKVVIVEWPSHIHGHANRQLQKYVDRIPGVDDYITSYGDSHVTRGRKYEPDESYGPHALRMPLLGANLPHGVEEWQDFQTLKVEIGVSRRWGDTKCQLDWKANRWAEVPGVVYVLCIALAITEPEHLPDFSYKLYQVANTGDVLPRQEPVNVVGPPTPTIVAFDSRRLLGLDPTSPLPAGFPDPDLHVDLYTVLEELRDL